MHEAHTLTKPPPSTKKKKLKDNMHEHVLIYDLFPRTNTTVKGHVNSTWIPGGMQGTHIIHLFLLN